MSFAMCMFFCTKIANMSSALSTQKCHDMQSPDHLNKHRIQMRNMALPYDTFRSCDMDIFTTVCDHIYGCALPIQNCTLSVSSCLAILCFRWILLVTSFWPMLPGHPRVFPWRTLGSKPCACHLLNGVKEPH